MGQAGQESGEYRYSGPPAPPELVQATALLKRHPECFWFRVELHREYPLAAICWAAPGKDPDSVLCRC